MKELIFLNLLLIVLGISCAHTKQMSADIQERPIVFDTALLEERYSLWGVQGMGLPLADHRYLLARDGEQEIKIQKAEDFAPLAKDITSAEQALEFVRFLTSTEIRTFLADIYYSEVHKKVEKADESDQEDHWFAIDAAQYEAWYMHEPLVRELDGQYRIERFVASYPRRQNQKIVPPRLLKIWEWVDREGHYRMEIHSIIAEGESVQKILLFQK
ncbi:hypothetical protein U27_01845 [Candidatus Vecturithrix granuli]|uniref:Lipoprotein n=1 Tax=Vecturithrix granuli TaxID=1499967 RepID=A0A0S6WAS7_VECG1|nr:hypothetical protein U27_01845 [Candidatus Vecturithrix granuli]